MSKEDQNLQASRIKVEASLKSFAEMLIRLEGNRGIRVRSRMILGVEKKERLPYLAVSNFLLYVVERMVFKLFLGRSSIEKAPGFRVLQVADFFCSPKTIDQVFEPLVSDWQEEYFAALNGGRWFKARWISIRYMWKALLAFGLSKLFAAVRAFSTKR